MENRCSVFTPLRRARVGVLITGTEVFNGLIKDGFETIIRAKVEKTDPGSSVRLSFPISGRRLSRAFKR